MKSDKEVEIKIKIEDREAVEKRLAELGAVAVGKKRQKDILYNSRQYDFNDTDEVLRLRIETSDQGHRAILTYKDSPTFTKDGQKIRDEFETEVEPEPTRKILDALGYDEKFTLEKTRTSYRLGELEIEIDELEFGTFLELEGTPDGIREARRKLGLEEAEPVREGYVRLMLEWKKARGD